VSIIDSNEGMEDTMMEPLERVLMENVLQVVVPSLQILRWLLNHSEITVLIYWITTKLCQGINKNGYLQIFFNQNNCKVVAILQRLLTLKDAKIQCQVLKTLAACTAHSKSSLIKYNTCLYIHR
jgi:hypothetical protein